MTIAFLVLLAMTGLVVWWLHRQGLSWWDVREPLLARWGRAWRWVVWSPRRIIAGVLIVFMLGWAWTRFGTESRPATAAATNTVDLPAGWTTWPAASSSREVTPPAAVEPTADSSSPPSVMTSPGADDDQVVGDDGAPEGRTFPGAQDPKVAAPAVLAATAAFLPVWGGAGNPEQRKTALTAVTTPDLAASLAPVPVDQIPHRFGEPTLQTLDRSTAIVVVPMLDLSGTAILRVTADGNRWVVAAVSRAEPGPATAPTTTKPTTKPTKTTTPPTKAKTTPTKTPVKTSPSHKPAAGAG